MKLKGNKSGSFNSAYRANELLIWDRYTSNILQYLRWILKHILASKYLCLWVYIQKGSQWEHKSPADVESIASWAKMGELWQKQDVSSFVTALMQNQWVSSALLAKLHSRTLLCCYCEIIWGLQNNCKAMPTYLLLQGFVVIGLKQKVLTGLNWCRAELLN